MTKQELLDYLSRLRAEQEQIRIAIDNIYQLAFEAAAMTLDEDERKEEQ